MKWWVRAAHSPPKILSGNGRFLLHSLSENRTVPLQVTIVNCRRRRLDTNSKQLYYEAYNSGAISSSNERPRFLSIIFAPSPLFFFLLYVCVYLYDCLFGAQRHHSCQPGQSAAIVISYRGTQELGGLFLAQTGERENLPLIVVQKLLLLRTISRLAVKAKVVIEKRRVYRKKRFVVWIIANERAYNYPPVAAATRCAGRLFFFFFLMLQQQQPLHRTITHNELMTVEEDEFSLISP